jgi:hypothetical protein
VQQETNNKLPNSKNKTDYYLRQQEKPGQTQQSG